MTPLVELLLAGLSGWSVRRRMETAAALAEQLDVRLSQFEQRLEEIGEDIDRVGRAQSAWRDTMEAQSEAFKERLDDLSQRASAAGGQVEAGPRSALLELVAGVQAEASRLFAPRPDDAEGPHVAVDGLEVEIKGDLDLTDGIGLRAYGPERGDPQAASTVRFSLRPTVRVVSPAGEDQ